MSYAPPATMDEQSQRTWASLIHVGGIFLAWIPGLIGFIVLKERGVFIRAHAVAALNFQLTMLLAWVLGILLAGFIFGYIIIFAAIILNIIFPIIAAMAASNNLIYRYPIAIPFVH